jgi:hypothetical protein
MPAHYTQAIIHGMVAGGLAGAVVALWFLVLDVVAGHPLSTPAALGAVALGRGGDSVAGPTALLIYTVIHFVVFCVLGVVAALVVQRLRRAAGPTGGGLFGLFGFTAVFHGGVRLMDAWSVVDVAVVQVLAANLVGGMPSAQSDGQCEKPTGWKVRGFFACALMRGALIEATQVMQFNAEYSAMNCILYKTIQEFFTIPYGVRR